MMTLPAAYDTETDPLTNSNFNIQINWDSSVNSAPLVFITDVEQVADFFATELQSSTPITINIDVGYGEINGSKISGSALGESETNLQLVTNYSTLVDDLGAPASQPKGNVYVSDAEAQALGILTTTPTVDGYVGFSSQSNIFDYNTNISNDSGIVVPSTQYDFEGTVAHEISEALGRIFLSGHSYSAYELFHYSSPGVQAFAANGGYFSLDGGTHNLGNFNTSHGGDVDDWGTGGTSNTFDGSLYDAFNAFGTPGQIAPLTPADLLTLKALGFQLNTSSSADPNFSTAANEAASALPGAPPPTSNHSTNVAHNENTTNDTPTTSATNNDISSTADTFVFPPNLGQNNNVETVADQIQPPHTDLLTAVSVDALQNGQDIGVAHDASGLDHVLVNHAQNFHLV